MDFKNLTAIESAKLMGYESHYGGTRPVRNWCSGETAYVDFLQAKIIDAIYELAFYFETEEFKKLNKEEFDNLIIEFENLKDWVVHYYPSNYMKFID